MTWLSSLALLACCGGLFCWPSTSLAQAKRHFAVRDSIEMATLSRSSGTGRNEEVKFSPDGRYFCLTTTRGILQSNEVESTIWLFETSSVTRFIAQSDNTQLVQPKMLVRMAGVSSHDQVNDDSIIEVRWAPDGHSIAFLGRNHTPERHLYSVAISSGRIRKFSPDGQDVREYELGNDMFVYTEVTPINDSELYNAADPRLPDVQVGTGLSLDALLFPRWQEVLWEKRPRQIWTAKHGRALPVIDKAVGKPISVRTDWFGSLCSVSPSGHYVVIKNYAERVPRLWESYQPAYEDIATKIVADEPNKEPIFNASRPQQYSVVDLQTGKMSVLVDAPLGRVAGYGYSDVTKVAWSADEREVALPNTFLPLGEPAGGPNPKRPCIAVVDIATRKAECVKESTPINLSEGAPEVVVLTDLRWRGGDQQLVATYSKFGGEDLLPEVFQRIAGHWAPGALGIRESAIAPLINKILVSVREGLNQPPVLMASDAKSRIFKQIWDPNPQLSGIDLGQAIVYHWGDKAGNEWTGGLVKPPNYIPGKRYPLVIQTHGFNQNQFLLDGFYPTANAARAMAGRGIVVLQVGEIPRHWGTPVEAELDGRAAYVSAIDQLVGEGLVDPGKVGIIGFSRTGWYVLDSVIHAPRYIAAATLAEFSSASFWQYLSFVDYISAQNLKGVAAGIGSEPFGEGLKKWITASPGFNTDKIGIPILFEANYPVSLVGYWDIYAALRLQRKPAELLYMRNGDHVLTRPVQRLISQEMNVDWYDFWLNAHEDPGLAKAGQYARWRELRKQYQAEHSVKEDPHSNPSEGPGT
jgi:dipeptidyl aminopeptidase/acylaminoacyl peptidase